MREVHLTLEANDGHPLAGTLLEPARRAIGAVLINAATGAPRRYYRPYAEFLATQGFVVLTYDYRGIGGSRFHAGPASALTLSAWGREDLAAALQYLHWHYPRLPLLTVGHSAGGQLLGLAANNHLVDGALAIASQSGYWGHWPARLQPVMAALWYGVLPLTARLLGRIPAALMGAELPAGVAREWARWCRHPDYMHDEAGQPLRKHFEAFRGPMRFYAIDDDHFYAPPRAVTALAGFYRNAHSLVRTLSPQDYGLRAIGHFGFFRPSMPRAAWQETADWLRSVAQPPLRQAA